MKIIILTLFLATHLVAQNWHEQIKDQNKLIKKITNGEKWEEILEYGLTEIKLPESYLSDISQSIKFSNSEENESTIDNFFHNLCDSTYTEFPYRKSGRLTKDLYIVPKKDSSHIAQILVKSFGKSLYSEFAQVVNIPEDELIPKLLDYLNNDSATRLCIRPMDWDELPYYISISDVAMELLEVKTYCDFFDNASQGNKLFSNLEQNEKKETIKRIEKWWKETIELNTSEKIEYYLTTECNYGYSYRYTCQNLLYYGDTTKAIRMYSMFYDSLSMPCRKEWDIGEILLSLGDRKVIEDCMNTSINYRCMDDSGMKCVEILLHSEYAHYRDNLLAEIVATEPHSQYRKSGTGPNYIWHKIFGELGNYNRYKLPKTLIELMSIKDEFNAISSYYTHKWKTQYSEEILRKYRICDLALLKYHETIEKLENFNWESNGERDKIIEKLRKKYED